eukprot:scaffold20816_cov18-Prasinocladus_malaysianus.AAC.2
MMRALSACRTAIMLLPLLREPEDEAKCLVLMISACREDDPNSSVDRNNVHIVATSRGPWRFVSSVPVARRLARHFMPPPTHQPCSDQTEGGNSELTIERGFNDLTALVPCAASASTRHL